MLCPSHIIELHVVTLQHLLYLSWVMKGGMCVNSLKLYMQLSSVPAAC